MSERQKSVRQESDTGQKDGSSDRSSSTGQPSLLTEGIDIEKTVAGLEASIRQLIQAVQASKTTPYRDALLKGPAEQSLKKSNPNPDQKIKDYQARIPKGACYRCGALGHFARECRDPIKCFKCGRLGHRSWQCGAPVAEREETEKVNLSKSNLETESFEMGMHSSEALILENTSEAHSIEDEFKRCVILHTNQDFPQERVEHSLKRQIPAFPWKVMEVADYRLLVEGPGWWRDRVIRQEVAKIDNINLRAYPWDASYENGARLKSLWIRVLGFPRKFWYQQGFERLISGFGVVFQIDANTANRSNLKEAKLRIGVCKPEFVPESKPVIFRNDRNEYCWSLVHFVVDSPVEIKKDPIKRKRVWIKKSDPGGSNSGTQDGNKGKRVLGSDEHNSIEQEMASTDEDLMDADNTGDGYTEGPGEVLGVVTDIEGVGVGNTQGIGANLILDGDSGKISDLEIFTNGEGKSESEKEEQGKCENEEVVNEEIEVKCGGELTVTEENMKDSMLIQPLATLPPATRQSLRLRLKNPEVQVLEKAMVLKNQDASSSGTSLLLSAFPYNDIADCKVVDLFEKYGLKLADKLEDSIEAVKFLKTLTNRQFESAIEEMEFKRKYGARFLKKEKDKKLQLDQIIVRVNNCS